jgi:uncharacterized protein with GYD domain
MFSADHAAIAPSLLQRSALAFQAQVRGWCSSLLASRLLLNHKGKSKMAIYMYQFAYTSESWAAQMKNPQNRVEQVGRAATEAAGGKFIGGWLCMGEYDAVLIADVPDIESMAAIALAVAAGGALKSGKTTPLMTGDQGVTALNKATAVAKMYRPAS